MALRRGIFANVILPLPPAARRPLPMRRHGNQRGEESGAARLVLSPLAVPRPERDPPDGPGRRTGIRAWVRSLCIVLRSAPDPELAATQRCAAPGCLPPQTCLARFSRTVPLFPP